MAAESIKSAPASPVLRGMHEPSDEGTAEPHLTHGLPGSAPVRQEDIEALSLCRERWSSQSRTPTGATSTLTALTPHPGVLAVHHGGCGSHLPVSPPEWASSYTDRRSFCSTSSSCASLPEWRAMSLNTRRLSSVNCIASETSFPSMTVSYR
jgi:hypothetical protein